MKGEFFFWKKMRMFGLANGKSWQKALIRPCFWKWKALMVGEEMIKGDHSGIEVQIKDNALVKI